MGRRFLHQRICLVPSAPCPLRACKPSPLDTPGGRTDSATPLLSLGFFSLWLAATGVHLYCLGYVYDFNLRPELLVPSIWVLLWTLPRRVSHFIPEVNPTWKRVLLVGPLVVTLAATGQRTREVFLLLTLLNAAIYAAIYFYRRDQRLALHLVLISLVALIGGWPEDLGRRIVGDFSRERCLGASAAAYFLLCAALSRNPKLGIFGALVLAAATGIVLDDHSNALHWAIQSGLAFVLIHSLRWEDATHAGAKELRIFACLLWAAHGFVWVRIGGTAWMTCAIATPVLVAYLAVRLFSGSWKPRFVPFAAVLVVLAAPGNFTAVKLQTAPAGLLAVAGSFLLFGLGTLAALSRRRWQSSHSKPFRSEIPDTGAASSD